MNRQVRKIISLVVIVLMLMSAVPMTSFAANSWCSIIGHDVDMVVTKEATCTEDGLKTEKCTRTGCDHVTGKTEVIPYKSHVIATIPAAAPTCDKIGFTDVKYCSECRLIIAPFETIPVLGHKFINSNVIESTCTEVGKKSGYCTVCNMNAVETIAPLGHLVTNELSWIIVDSPSCNKEGKRVAKCVRCGDQAVEVIPALGHQEVVFTPAKEPTCSSEGVTESKQCSICKTVTVKAEMIEKLPHTFGEWIVMKSATCMAAGVKEAKCTVCGATEHETIPRLPHTEVVVIAVEASCYTAGKTSGKKCTICNTVTQGCEIIPAFGHSYIRDNERCIDPDCLNGGKFFGICNRCGDIKDEFLPAKGHDEYVVPGTPADCTLTGTSDFKKCKVCGEITAEPEQTPALGHDFVIDAAKSTPATCTQNGLEYLNCLRCKASERRETTSNGHNYQPAWQTIVAPTCTQTGVSIKICKDCFNIQTNTLPVIGHTDVDFDGKCDLCGFAGNFVPTDSCTCNCHKTGIANIFFKVMLFFQKLFRVNRVCKCGVAHY